MATMTYDNARVVAPKAGRVAKSLDAVAAAGEKPGFFRRMVKAMQESRMRQAEIEIRRYRALVQDNDTGFQDALLPFRGE
ncbi:MAG: hypothetical protein ACRCTI_18380 [Beijerinckiaceae bacterium]